MSDGNHDGAPDPVSPKRKRGRPRKARDLADGPAFAVLMDKKVPYVRDGKRESLSPLEALEQQAFASAWDGKPSAIVEVLNMIASDERARLPAANGFPRIRWEHTPASIDDVLILLQLATPTYVPEHWEEHYGRTLQLDPEAVAFALASHPPKRLNADHQVWLPAGAQVPGGPRRQNIRQQGDYRRRVRLPSRQSRTTPLGRVQRRPRVRPSSSGEASFPFEEPATAPAARNPPWTRDEVILALHLYHRHESRDPGDTHPDVTELSTFLRALAGKLDQPTYRNGNGVVMKLMNFRSLDPAFTSKGDVGLSSVSKLDREIWTEFADRRLNLAVAAEAIRQGAKLDMDEDALDELDSYEAKEGRVSFRLHRTLKRDRKVVALRKAAALKASGKLECEAREFDFAAAYGERGVGYIEAHHANPVHAMKPGDVTKAEDLVLLCANCHRMVHAAKPWLTFEQLRACLAAVG